MQISFDERADALYIQFQKGKSKKTIKLRDGILVDIGKNGRLFGLEIFNVSRRISRKDISHVDINLPVRSS